ncbi:uncharacterized protein LOC143064441, partial [Mytilus galloprovincialis]|uniref:uncharacterized protein LOC143064441 n=1 Tax=Mytilus galloprovincialis TaxID=29158 RepID=UPI003F7B5372
CNGTLYWLPLLSNRQQQTIKLDKTRAEFSFNHYVYLKTFFYDDWRLIACETALNIAIRHGHLEIVKLLLNETFSSVNCKTYDGKTPLMTAVRYNRTEFFYHLYLRGANLTTKCVHAFDINSLRSKLDLLELTLLTTEQCPAGASIVHFIAMYGNFEMMKFMYKNGFVDWEQRDADEATPLHFAFCNYNYIFIVFNYLKKLNLNFSAVTVNGSSIYHSAATCRSLILYLFYRHDRYQFNIPDCLDYKNRSILHYSMLLPMRQTDDDLYIEDKESGLILAMFTVCLNAKHNFLHIDNKGKNFLHYAAKNGNYFGFINVFRSLSDHDIMSLLTQKDQCENTPVDEIFQTMEKRSFFDPILIPSGCEIKDVFYTKCQTKFEYILTNHEMCLLKTLWYLHQKDGFSKFNATKLLSIAIRKSRIYPILMLKVYAEEQFQHIVQNNPPFLHFITEYDGPDIAEFFLTRDNSLKCDGSFSPLHEIVMNERNTHSMHYNHKFLTQYLKDYSCKILDKCFDKDGYNLLHRAVMGGNLLGTQFLVKKGMNVIHVSRHEKSALEISIIKAPFLENDAVPLRYSKSFPFQVLQYISENRTDKTIIDFDITLQYDQTAIFLLENVYTSRPSRRQKIAKLLCKPNKSHLSLVHLAAAKGFIGFLKKMHSAVWGRYFELL